jgi:hypothetical protein
MHLFGQDIHALPGLILIVTAGVLLYIASRAGADALAGIATLSPGRMAIGHWVPIAAVALLAMIVDRSDVALGVVSASSVACLSLAAGTVAFLAPPGESTPAPAWARRPWPMILPTAMLVFLAGFRGELTLTHAGILLVEGVVVLLLWTDTEPARGRDEDGLPPVASRAGARARISPLRVLQLLLAVGLAAIGAWAAVHGAARGSGATRTIYTDVDVASAGLLAATILSPLLVLPMLGGGVELAHRGQGWVAITSQVGVVLLNLCLLLPVVVVEGHYHPLRTAVQWTQAEFRGEPYFSAATVVTQAPATRPATTRTSSTSPSIEDDEPEPVAAKAVPLPLAVWRVDVVALIALGLFLLPVAIGRWPLSKGQGLGLIAGYIAYLLLAMMLGVRLI